MLRIVHPRARQNPVASLKNCQERWGHRAADTAIDRWTVHRPGRRLPAGVDVTRAGYTSAVLNNASIRLHAFSAWSWL
jgi:hypothetical protein